MHKPAQAITTHQALTTHQAIAKHMKSTAGPRPPRAAAAQAVHKQANTRTRECTSSAQAVHKQANTSTRKCTSSAQASKHKCKQTSTNASNNNTSITAITTHKQASAQVHKLECTSKPESARVLEC